MTSIPLTEMKAHEEEPVSWLTITGVLMLMLVLGSLLHLSVASAATGTVHPAPSYIVKAGLQKHPPKRHTKQKVAWVICQVVGRSHCRAYLDVAWCESTLNLGARDYANGTHIGLFQLGRAERREYGYGSSAWAQTRGAKRLHAARGWEPWVCKPAHHYS